MTTTKRIAWPLGAALALLGVLLWLALRHDSVTTPPAVADVPEAEPPAPAPSPPPPPTDPRESRRQRDRLAHEECIAKILRAHDARPSTDPIGPCSGPGCARVGEEVRDILDGCREQAPGSKGRLTLTADVLAAPEVGTRVESVTLVGEGATDALRECMVESMYTLDLGEPEHMFGEQVQVFVGGGLTFALDANSDPALVQAARQLAEYDDKAGAAAQDGAYVIKQGPIPAGAAGVAGETG